MKGRAIITRVPILSKIIGRMNVTGDELDDELEAEAW
jgi:hypothetical protein